MLTHESRVSERAVTVPQFEALGLTVTPFIGVGQPSPIANGLNGMSILTAAHDQDSDVLIVEDDVDLSPDFPEALTAARRHGRPVTFWLCKPHNHSAAWRKAINGDAPPPTSGFYPVERLPSWFGSQALYLPAEVVRAAVDAPMFGSPNTSLDYWLRDNVLRILWAALPNPVQHRNAATLVDPNRVPRISPTFHMERRNPWPSSTSPTSLSPVRSSLS